MKTRLQTLLLAAAAFALAGCAGTGAPAESAPCTCGTDEAAFHGCACPDCMSGAGNPDNPDCLCDPLDFEGEAR